MSKMVTRVFATLDEAKHAVVELENLGVPYSEISVISGAHDKAVDGHAQEHLGDHDPLIETEARKGAAAGAGVGGAAGLIAGLAMLTVPGLGAVAAVGWLVGTIGATLGGAALGTATGGLVATLTHHGMSEKDAHVFSEAVKRGETLVSARVSDHQFDQAEALMSGLQAGDAETRGAAYRSAGWTASEPADTRS